MKKNKMIKKSIWNIIALAIILTAFIYLKSEVKADIAAKNFLYIGGKFYYDIDKNLSGNGWSYQADPKTITLNNYNGSEIELSINDDVPCDLLLKGDNTITVDKGHNITYTYPDSSKYTETHKSPISKIGVTSLVITGGGNLTVNNKELPFYNTSYVNCGTIKVINNSTTDQYLPFEYNDFDPSDEEALPAYIYNTNFDFQNVKYDPDMVILGDWIYKSTITCSANNTYWDIEDEGPQKNVKLYGKNGNEISYDEEGYAYDLNYTKAVYGSDASFCVPGCLTRATNASGQLQLLRKCLDCGKTIYTSDVKINKLDVSPISFDVVKGDKIQLNTAVKTTIEPSYAASSKIIWGTDRPDIVSIDSNGLATILKEFSGSDGQWAIYAKVGNYKSYISLWYERKATKITASNLTKTYSSNAQSFNIGATCNSGSKLTYSSDNSNITVNSAGKVTVKAKYVGSATITVKAAQTDKYESAAKKITVTVNPSKTSIVKATNVKGKQIKVSWKKNKSGSGYQIQYSTSKTFAKGNKSINVKKNSIVKATISKLTKGKTYYVRMRTYKTVSGKKYYAAWSSAKKVKIIK